MPDVIAQVSTGNNIYVTTATSSVPGPQGAQGDPGTDGLNITFITTYDGELASPVGAFTVTVDTNLSYIAGHSILFSAMNPDTNVLNLIYGVVDSYTPATGSLTVTTTFESLDEGILDAVWDVSLTPTDHSFYGYISSMPDWTGASTLSFDVVPTNLAFKYGDYVYLNYSSSSITGQVTSYDAPTGHMHINVKEIIGTWAPGVSMYINLSGKPTLSITATTTSSVTPIVGNSVSVTTQKYRGFTPGQVLSFLKSGSTDTFYMLVTAYVETGTTLTGTVLRSSNASAQSSWYIGLSGPIGDTGAAGADGTNGTDGTDGDDGASIISGEFVSDDLVFTKDDATTVTIADAKIDLTGPTGPAGAGDTISPATNTADYIPQWSGANSKTLKDGINPATLRTLLTPVSVKTSNYTANANELVPCDISSGSFAITLPTAPAQGTQIEVDIVTAGSTTTLEIKSGGSDKFWKTTGPQSIYLSLNFDCASLLYDASTGVWFVTLSSAQYNFATNNSGIDSQTPVTNADISIDTTSRVLTITPPLGYLRFFVDGGGKVTRFRKTSAVTFPAFTDTSGIWYFYFDNTGTAVTSQTAWNDFNQQVPVYRVLWNKDLFKFTVTSATATLGDTYTNNSSTFTVKETISGGTTLICERTTGTNDPEASGNLTRATGAGTNPIVFSAWDSSSKLVAQYIEYHINDIPAATHLALHLDGARWSSGLSVASNAITTGTPDTDGRNTVLSLSSGTILDDNLSYTITSDTTPTNPWEQDLGMLTPASLNATNSGLFEVFTQNSEGEVFFLPATRFPFAWNATSNRPETISSVGARTVVPDNRWFVYFVYCTQNPTSGKAIKVVSAPPEFTSLANAQAYNWASIQALYPTIFGGDFEIRPLYRIIFYNDNSGGGAYPSGCKYSVIREIQDIRKGSVTSTAVATGSLPASSVTYVPSGTIGGTNVQTAIEELDAQTRTRVVSIKVVDDATTLTTGDGKATIVIPEELNGYNLTQVGAHIFTTSSSGLPNFMVRNVTDSADMLSTAMTIDATEYDTKDATTAAVIDTTKDDVVTGDVIAVDIDGIGTGSKGLEIRLGFSLP